jgi:hypothetical protein
MNGNAARITDMSLFANGDLHGLRIDSITGTDYTYGDWATIPGTDGEPNPYNAAPRIDALGNPETDAGAGVAGTIAYRPNSAEVAQKNMSAGSSQRYGYRDYDEETYTRSSNLRPLFAKNTWGNIASQPSNTMTFPFLPSSPDDDADALATLKEKAQSQSTDGQSHYLLADPGETVNVDDIYPQSSDLEETVVFIEFANGTADSPDYDAKGLANYDATSSDADNKVKGILVIMYGDLKVLPSGDTFQGAIFARDGDDVDNAGEPDFNCTTDGRDGHGLLRQRCGERRGVC